MQLALKFKEIKVRHYIWSVMLKHGHFEEYIRNKWAVLKCGAGEE
jgi:hypothetical protein